MAAIYTIIEEGTNKSYAVREKDWHDFMSGKIDELPQIKFCENCKTFYVKKGTHS